MDQNPATPSEPQAQENPVTSRSHFNPVVVSDTTGTVFLGILSIILTILLIITLNRYDKLVKKIR